MINNYNNLPSIPCNNRESLISAQDKDKKTVCEGLNPDKVYSTLFPGIADPATNFTEYAQKIPNNFTFNSVPDENYNFSNTSKSDCAKKCINSSTCSNYQYLKPPNTCMLLPESQKTRIDDNSENGKMYSQIYKRITNFDKIQGLTTPANNVEDNFFPQNGPYDYGNTEPLGGIKFNLSKNECLNECLQNDSCKTALFMEGNDTCYTAKKNTPDINQNLIPVPNDMYKMWPINTYVKNQTIKTKSDLFNVPDSYDNTYKEYPTFGKPGDSFCKFDLGTNQCLTSMVVPNQSGVTSPEPSPTEHFYPEEDIDASKLTSRQLDRLCKKDDFIYSEYYYFDEIDAQELKEKKKEPLPPRVCIPPNCPPVIDTGAQGQLLFNGEIQTECKKGDKKCQNKISQISYYDRDYMGLATENGTPNPPNGYLPYTEDYNRYDNLKFNSQTKKMIENPKSDEFDMPEDCQNWCTKSYDCGGYSYKFAPDGKPSCTYYGIEGMVPMKDKLEYQDGTYSFIKRGNPVIQNVEMGPLKKPYFNNFTPEQTGVQKVKICVPEGFQNKKREENFINKTYKFDSYFNQFSIGLTILLLIIILCLTFIK